MKSTAFVDTGMLAPVWEFGSEGHVPFCVAIQWIMTAGGSKRICINDADAWACAVEKLRPLLSTGHLEIIGTPFGRAESAIVPSLVFATMPIPPPLSGNLGNFVLSSAYIDCCPYFGRQDWERGHNDKVYQPGEPSPKWTNLQVRKADLLSRWPKPLRKSDERRGRKPKYDWVEAKLEAYRLWRERGDFSEDDQVSDWNAQAHLEQAVLSHIEKTVGKGKGPADSTLRGYISDWVTKWREAAK